MYALLKFIFDVCLLRRGPQDAPANTLLVGLFALAYLLLGCIGFSNYNNPLPVIYPAAQSLLVLAGCVYLLLSAMQRLSRLSQTLVTLLSTSCLLGVANLLVDSLLPANIEATPNPVLVLIWLGLFCWSFVIDAHIFRHALDRSFSMGMLVAVTVFALNQLLLAAWYLPHAVLTDG